MPTENDNSDDNQANDRNGLHDKEFPISLNQVDTRYWGYSDWQVVEVVPHNLC